MRGQALPTLGEQLPQLPIPQHGGHQAQAPAGILRAEQPVDGRAVLSAIAGRAARPTRTGPLPQSAGGFLGEHEEVRGVRRADGRIFPLSTRRSSAYLPDRLHHREPALSVRMLTQLEQALVHQRLDAVDHVDAEILFRVGHGLGRFERAAAEDRQAAEQPLFGFAEQIVTPAIAARSVC